MPNGHPLKRGGGVGSREPFDELARNEFLEFLDNLLNYAIKEGKMSESRASELYLSYEGYFFPEMYDPITGKWVADPSGEGQYIDPTKLPAWEVIKQFTPQAMTKRGEQQVLYKQYLKDFTEYEDYQKTKTLGVFEGQRVTPQNIAQLREAERAKARMRGQYERGEDVRERPPMPSPAEVGHPFLEKLPQHMQRHFSLGKLWEKFQREMPGARTGWWAALHAEPSEDEREFYSWGAPVAGGFETTGGRTVGLEAQSRPGGRDPWESWLEKYPFLEEFGVLPPEQRGFYPRKYAPPTRWV